MEVTFGSRESWDSKDPALGPTSFQTKKTVRVDIAAFLALPYILKAKVLDHNGLETGVEIRRCFFLPATCCKALFYDFFLLIVEWPKGTSCPTFSLFHWQFDLSANKNTGSFMACFPIDLWGEKSRYIKGHFWDRTACMPRHRFWTILTRRWECL